MSALMPETNRKNCVDPTVFPMRRQNTGNQTPANASTSAAQLTASPGPYTPSFFHSPFSFPSPFGTESGLFLIQI